MDYEIFNATSGILQHVISLCLVFTVLGERINLIQLKYVN